MNKVKLVIDGLEYSGWKDVSITSQLQSFARAFKLVFTIGTGEKPLQINSASIVEVYAGEDKVLSGYVTDIAEEFSPGETTISVSGAGKGIDLVECSVPMQVSKAYKNTTIGTVVSTICSSFGIHAIDEVGRKDNIDLNFSPEDKVSDVLKGLVSEYQLLLTDDENGNIHLVRIGSRVASDVLRFSQNLLYLKKTQKTNGLYRDYVLIGQGSNATSDREADAHRLKETASLAWRPRTFVKSESGDMTSL